jgi:hypothetical protein
MAAFTLVTSLAITGAMVALAMVMPVAIWRVTTASAASSAAAAAAGANVCATVVVIVMRREDGHDNGSRRWCRAEFDVLRRYDKFTELIITFIRQLPDLLVGEQGSIISSFLPR